MKITKTKESVEEVRDNINKAFGARLPKKYQWSKLPSKGVFSWYLSDLKANVIAKIIDDGKIRIVHLEETIFKTKGIQKNPKSKHRIRKQFPPPFKPSENLLDRIITKYDLNIYHENPDPPDCRICGLNYRDLKTGFDFRTIQDMLFVDSNDPKDWRQKGRHSVLGLWYEIKQSMWQDHIEMCRKPKQQKNWLEDFSPSDFEY